MTSDRPVSPSSLPNINNSIIPNSVTNTSAKTSSDNLYNISYLLKRMRAERNSKIMKWFPVHATRQQSIHHEVIIHDHKPLLDNTIVSIDTEQQQQQQTAIHTPTYRSKKMSKFYSDRLKEKKNILHINQSEPYKRLSRLGKYEYQQFNYAAYCISYCTIIIIGVTIGGWIGGLFEFISSGHNGCNNEHHGNINCQIKYASFNVTTHCINIFYTNSITNNIPYICLCRFRNNSKGKYRDCEFLHAKIQYI